MNNLICFIDKGYAMGTIKCAQFVIIYALPHL